MIENDPPLNPSFTEKDLEMLKAREAHFSGSFSLMIEYYQSEGQGRDPEFQMERMLELDVLEKSIGENLSNLLLSEEDQEEIENSKSFYQRLKSSYKKKKDSSDVLIADLLTSEDSSKAIDNIVLAGKKAVPALIALMQNEDLKNPLFPGFGNAATLAVECLRRIKDDSAIIALFEEIGHEEVVDEEGALLALKAIGEPAMQFLLRIAASLPITTDNERAAIGLIHFKDMPKVAERALYLLENESFRKAYPLSSYLALIASDLKDEKLRERFLELAKNSPPILKNEIELIVKTWKVNTKKNVKT